MSWGADAVQGMGSGSTQAGAGGFADKTSSALGSGGGFSDIFKAAQEDIKRNEANKVQLPPPAPGVQMPSTSPQARQLPGPMQYGQPQAPPVITGFNL